MKAKPLAIGAAIAAIVALGINDLRNKDANALERAHDRAGLQVDCSITKIDGNRWGACRYKNGAPASAWLKRDDAWVAANGNAHKVIDRLARGQDLAGLPSLQRDTASAPAMPAELFQ
ncbi:hypothetical protein [Pseudomonas sp. MWU12-2345]|uniref:hypothetical protein n=1 Tax=Pseudomonas sp. MWU12-2345 TaxID=2928689 RepID=UPI00201016AE|nr:hypothetical protein [Pseudomonas sp. MWU12-2345]